MRIRQILLIHPSRSIRALIKKYVFAELNDTEIVESDSCEDSIALLNTKRFHVVLATSQMGSAPVSQLKDKLGLTRLNSEVPLIVIAESESNGERDRLIQQGFEHVVQIRLRPFDLIQSINRVCNPRAWRRDVRYHLPDAKVIIHIDGHETDATVINLSRGGILLECATDSPELFMKDGIRIILSVPTASGVFTLSGMTCKISRLNVIQWRPNNTPAAMRATFIFDNLDQSQRDQLAHVLQIAEQEESRTHPIESR